MSPSALRAVTLAGAAALTLAVPTGAMAASHGHAHQDKAKTHSTHKHHARHHGKPAPARFTAVGTVTAVDAGAGTITLADKGGSKDLHGKSVTVVVGPKTKVTRDDAAATLAQVAPGDHVAANGTRVGAALDATHVNADSAPEPQASSSASPDDDAAESAQPTEAPESPEASQSPEQSQSPQPSDSASSDG